VSLEKLHVLLLECHTPVVLLLPFDIPDHRVPVRSTDAERAIAALPGESFSGSCLVDPPRRGAFDFAHDRRDRHNRGDFDQRMDVILDSADRDRVTALISDDSAKVGKESLTDFGNERTAAFFRGEHHVKRYSCIRRHGLRSTMRKSQSRIVPRWASCAATRRGSFSAGRIPRLKPGATDPSALRADFPVTSRADAQSGHAESRATRSVGGSVAHGFSRGCTGHHQFTAPRSGAGSAFISPFRAIMPLHGGPP